MSKREKIVVILTVLAVIYGAYNFLFSSAPKVETQSQQDTNQTLSDFLAGIAQDIRPQAASAIDGHIIRIAAAGWEDDPMIGSSTRLKKEKELIIVIPKPVTITTDLIYSGYLALGNLNMAVINGIEYLVGEEIESGGYIVEGVFPERALIRIKGKQKKIVLPLQEADTVSRGKTS